MVHLSAVRGRAVETSWQAARRRLIFDELLTLHDDDQEAWYYRAQLAGGAGLFGGQASAVPYYKALLRINSLHPNQVFDTALFVEGGELALMTLRALPELALKRRVRLFERLKGPLFQMPAKP